MPRLPRGAPVLVVTVLVAVAYRHLLKGEVQAAKDLFALSFPDTFTLVTRWSHGELPLWQPEARLGQPFLGLLYTQALYLPRIVTGFAFGPVLGPNVMHAFHSVLAWAGLYLAGRKLGLRREAACIAATPFAFSAFFTEFSQNLSFASSAAWGGWILLAALRLRARPTWQAVAALALALGASILAGSPEMVLWQGAMVLAVSWGGAWRRRLVAAGLSLGWAAAAGLVLVWPAAELSRDSSRAGDAAPGALQWSVSLVQLLSIAVPQGDRPRAGPYWGGDDQFFLFTLFLGAVPVALALFAASTRRHRWLVLFAAACLALSLGKHFLPAQFVLAVPPLRSFRYPVKYAVGGLFALSVLGGLGAQRAVALARRFGGRARAGWGTLVVAAAVLALGARLGGARLGLVTGSVWTVLALALTAAVVLGAGRRAPALLVAAVVLEALAAPQERWDLIPAATLLRPSPVARQVLADAPGRVFARVDFDDTDPFWCAPEEEDDDLVSVSRERLSGMRFVESGLRSASGYGFRDPWRLTKAFKQGSTPFALAGVTHFIVNARTDPPAQASPVPTVYPDVWVWRTPTVFPRAWVVHRAQVADDDTALEALRSPAERFRTEALVDRGPSLDGVREPGCLDDAVVEEEHPEHLRLEVHSCGPGVLVLGDRAYPGWRATIDGVAGEPRRADFFLRGVAVPAGHHRVEWTYSPTWWRLGGPLSALAWLGAIVLALWRRPLRLRLSRFV